MSYISGTWNVHCDVCGFKFKSTEIRKRWDNLMVCDKDWEADHPQKFLRVRSDKISVPFVREESTDLQRNICYIYAIAAYADAAEADCALADKNTPSYAIVKQLKG
jgi:hypothetical protein